MEELEIIYLVGSKGKDGEYRKLVKCYDVWFYTENEAIDFLKNKVDKDLQVFNAVFEAEITINKVKKILDGKIFEKNQS